MISPLVLIELIYELFRQSIRLAFQQCLPGPPPRAQEK